MAKQLLTIQTFYKGISPSNKLGDAGYFNFAKNLDIYTEPSAVTLNPRTEKEIASTDALSPFSGMIKWIVSGSPYDTNSYFYSWDGKLFKRDSGGTFTNIRSVAASSGEGMELFGGTVDGVTQVLLYTQNKQIGYYGPLGGAAAFKDNWQTGLNGKSVTGASSVGQYSPIKAFRAGFAVGNGNQLSWYDGSTWTAARLTFPVGFNVKALEIIDEYLAIAAITPDSRTYVFFWDGDATTYNFFIKIDDGVLGCMINYKNKLFAVLEGKGKLIYIYPTYQKLIDIPNLARFKDFASFPGSITNWNGIVYFGLAAATNSTDLVQGIYQWGSLSDSFPDALNFGFTASPDITSLMAIGAVTVLDNKLFFSWGVNGVNEGIDRVEVDNPPFAHGDIEFLIYDGGDATREDMATNLKAYYTALQTGEGIQLGYKTNRAASYTMGTADTTVGDNHTRLPVDSDKARFYEFQMEALLTASGDTSPSLLGVSLKSDNLIEETKV